MEIKELSELDNKPFWISKIKEGDWRAAKYLAELLETGAFYKLCGNTSKVFLLTDG